MTLFAIWQRERGDLLFCNKVVVDQRWIFFIIMVMIIQQNNLDRNNNQVKT